MRRLRQTIGSAMAAIGLCALVGFATGNSSIEDWPFWLIFACPVIAAALHEYLGRDT